MVEPLSASQFANREVQNLQTFPVTRPHHLLFGNCFLCYFDLPFLFLTSLSSLCQKIRYTCICIDGV